MLFDSPEAIEALEFYVSLFDDAIADKRENQPIGNLPVLAAGAVAQEFTTVENLKTIATYTPDVYPTRARELRRSRGSQPTVCTRLPAFSWPSKAPTKRRRGKCCSFSPARRRSRR